MSRLRDLLVKQYAEHYARVNTSIDPKSLNPKSLRGYQLIYGKYVDSLPSGSKVLDLGCGTGFLLYWLSGKNNIIPYGVDSSLTQVEQAKISLPHINIICREGLEFLKENPNTFMGIFCTDVLEHIPGDDLLLEWVEAARLSLKPGGFFCCRAPNAANLSGNYSRYMDLTHERCFTSASIIQLLEIAGFENCQVIKIRAEHLTGRIRLFVEYLLHRIIFLICGRGKEAIFTYNVIAIGLRY